MAREVGTTPDFLNKLFKKYEHKTFYEYLTEIRLEKARRLILQIDLLEDEIALRVAYEDEKYLRSIFRQQTGINPFELRNVIHH